jgi:hypothetical protein
MGTADKQNPNNLALSGFLTIKYYLLCDGRHCADALFSLLLRVFLLDKKASASTASFLLPDVQNMFPVDAC